MWQNIVNWGHNAWGAVTSAGRWVRYAFHSALQFAQSILKIVVFVVSDPVLGAYIALGALVDLITGNTKAANNMIAQIPSYTQKHQVDPLKALMLKMFKRIWAWIKRQISMLYKYVRQQIRETRAYALRLVTIERKYRIWDFNRSEAYTRAQIKALHQLIEREAAGGYQAGDQGHADMVRGLLNTIAERNPLLSGLTSRVIGLVLDVATIEDPFARFAVAFIMKRVISGLGVDKALGELTASLLDSLIGAGPPKDLRSVIDDLTSRIGAVEGQWATFMSDGGPQILQAGEEWKALTGLAADAGLLAFAVEATRDPSGTARALSGIVRPIGEPVITSLAAALGRG